jgi:hypothetical protein
MYSAPLSLAILISPNYGLINMSPSGEMIVHASAIYFAPLNDVDWTIIDEVIVHLSLVWFVRLFLASKVPAYFWPKFKIELQKS